MVEKDIIFGQILKINKNYIEVTTAGTCIPYAISKNYIFDEGLYEGEYVYILKYTIEMDECRPITVEGIVDMKKYENPIRESQKMPKGWLNEPNVVLVEDYGTIEVITSDNLMKPNFYFCPECDPSKLYPLNDYYIDEPLRKGVIAIAQTYYITYPDGDGEEYRQVFSKARYTTNVNRPRK